MDDVIQRLQAELERLNDRANRAERQWREADDDRKAFARVITVLNRTSPNRTDPIAALTIGQIKGMTQEQAIVHIATQNGGRLFVGAAKKLLLTAGLIRNPKNAATILYSIVQKSERFERVTRGEYRLVVAPGHGGHDAEDIPWLRVAEDDIAGYEPDESDMPRWSELADDESPTMRDLAG